MSAQNSAQADADPSDGRDETVDERMDRNWIEILQELRVTQTGTQILTGFLLSIAFQPTFAKLGTFEHRVYLFLVMTAVLTTALGLAPVNLHRGLFRQHEKTVVVRVGHLILLGVDHPPTSDDHVPLGFWRNVLGLASLGIPVF